MSKYDPLTAYLSSQPREQLRLNFAEIEEVLGFSLPASKKYPAWWSNSTSNNPMTNAWLAAGYRTEQVDVIGEKVTFTRESPLVAEAPDELEDLPRSALFGCMKGTTFVAPGVDLTAPMDIDWKYDTFDAEDVIIAREIEKVKADTSLSISQKIRELARMGMPRAEIAKQLGKRYQHVRNVLVADGSKAA